MTGPKLSSPEPEQPTSQDAIAETLARTFHEAYEILAPDFGYKTREESAKPWEDVPEQNRKLMIATAKKIIELGWLSPERFEIVKREHVQMCELYFDVFKIVGGQPDDEITAGPMRAKELVSRMAYFRDLAADRFVELVTLRREYANRTGETAPDAPAAPTPRLDFNELLDFGAEELYRAVEGYADAGRADMAEKTRAVAQSLLEIKTVLQDPAKTIRGVVIDRDMWQRKAEALEEKVVLTELALGQTQDALVDLTNGHDKMIRLLERFARLYSAGPSPAFADEITDLAKDVTAILNSGDVRVIEL